MVFNSSVLNSIARAGVIVGIYFLCFGCAAILPLRRTRADSSVDRRKTIFTWVWIAPGLLFFTFIYLKFVNSGYLLALACPQSAHGWVFGPQAGMRISRSTEDSQDLGFWSQRCC